MGAKAWFAAYFDSDPKDILSEKPELDRLASVALAERLFAGHTIEEKENGSLVTWNRSTVHRFQAEAFDGCQDFVG